MNELLTLVFKPIILIYVISGMLALGLSQTVKRIIEPLKDVRITISTVVASYIIHPFLAASIARLFGLDPSLRYGIVLFAMAAGAEVGPIFTAKSNGNVSLSGGILGIGSVVYAATGEIIPLSSYDDLSQDLQKYIGRIETYFQGKPVNLQDSLRAAQREYRAAINPAGAASPAFKPPEEPRKIPFLYYPLLGIVLLLLCGALTTLYMVLLERLLSALSLDPAVYGLLMGGGAVLLAVGTLLLLWRLRSKS